MPKLVIHPRGFCTVAKKDVANDIFNDGDSEINAVYAQFIREPSCIRDWNFVASVMRVASRLIGSSYEDWLKLQTENPYLHKQAINFVNDSNRFIEGHSRTISIVNWIELLDERPEALPRKLSTPSINDFNRDTTNNLNYLNLWLQRNNGLSDLIISLFTMYGAADPSSMRIDGTRPVSVKNPYLAQLKKLLGQ